MSEKRRYMRFNVIMDALLKRADSSKKLKVNNFSKEGVGLLSREPLEKGEELEIEMTIPGDNVPVIFNGEVAWSASPNSDTADYKGGVQFKDISNEDKSRILEYIYRKWIIPGGSE